MSLPRGMRLPRGARKLWWADPPFAFVQRVLAAAERDVPRLHGIPLGHDAEFKRAWWRRRVSEVFHQRLKSLGIYVEGA